MKEELKAAQLAQRFAHDVDAEDDQRPRGVAVGEALPADPVVVVGVDLEQQLALERREGLACALQALRRCPVRAPQVHHPQPRAAEEGAQALHAVGGLVAGVDSAFQLERELPPSDLPQPGVDQLLHGGARVMPGVVDVVLVGAAVGCGRWHSCCCYSHTREDGAASNRLEAGHASCVAAPGAAHRCHAGCCVGAFPIVGRWRSGSGATSRRRGLM